LSAFCPRLDAVTTSAFEGGASAARVALAPAASIIAATTMRNIPPINCSFAIHYGPNRFVCLQPQKAAGLIFP
jgi:hypothetical protein